MNVTLRPATLKDAELLLSWRNDSETRARSFNSEVVQLSDHIAWLRKSLDNPARELFVAECEGKPVGTVRADLEGSVKELSWTIAPCERRQGLAKAMVRELVAKIDGDLRAEIKPDNIASVRVAMHIGMLKNGEIDGVLHYILRR